MLKISHGAHAGGIAALAAVRNIRPVVACQDLHLQRRVRRAVVCRKPAIMFGKHGLQQGDDALPETTRGSQTDVVARGQSIKSRLAGVGWRGVTAPGSRLM